MSQSNAILRQEETLKLALIVLALSVLPAILASVGMLRFDLQVSNISDAFSRYGTDSQTLQIVYKTISTGFVNNLLTWSAFCIAIITAALSILHFYIKRDAATPIIGMAFFSVAIMEVVYTIFSAELIQGQADMEKMLPALWTAARFFHALIMIGGASYFLWRGSRRWEGQFTIMLVSCFVMASLGTLMITSVLQYADYLPALTYPDHVVSRPFDLIPLSMYLVAGLIIYPRFHRKVGSPFSLALLLSAIPDIMTQCHMAFGSAQLFDDHYVIAALLKVFAYAIPLAGLMWDYMRTHRAAQEHLAQIQLEMTERFRAEAQWAESEKRLRSFLNNARDLVQITNADGAFRFVNRAWEQALGYHEAELKEMTLPDIVSPDERGQLKRYLELVLDETVQDPGEIVVHLAARDGGRVLVEGTASTLHDEGKSPAIYVSFRDITERQQALDTLRATQGELDRFFSLSIDMLCIMEFSGVLKRVSPAWEQVLGYEQEELQERNCLQLVHPDDRVTMSEALQHLQAGAPRAAFECRMLHREGEERWISWAACLYAERKLIYAAARDDSDRKRFERELINAKLEADGANESKSAFLASMSHEIRTPLNAILGMADLLDEGDLSADQCKYVDVLRSSCNSLLTLINDLLDLSKVEAGQLEIEAIEFELHELLENVSHMLAMRADEKDVQLLLHIDRGLPLQVVGDPTRLRQILVNLIGNAVKFTERGEVCIHAEQVEEEGDHVTIRFSVADTGIGIPSDRLERIFESFTQADSSIARKYGGTGLGLAISKRLVAMMGGAIEVESRVGEGTTFTFTVRFANPEVGNATVKLILPPTLMPGSRAMIIDRNQTSRQIMMEFLSELDIESDEEEDVERGLQAMEEARRDQQPGYHYALIDAGGANLQGLGAVGRIRKMNLADKIMVMVSYQRLHEVKAVLRRHTEIVYLVKPIHRAELYRAFAPSRLPHAKRQSTAHAPPGERAQTIAPRAESSPSTAVRSLRILIAEDTEDNQVLFSFYLKSTPHKVDIASNGREAVDLFKAHRYDLVLMDIEMPEMNGYEAVAAIRQYEQEEHASAGNTPLSEVPVITLTAHAMHADKEKCLQRGFNGFLTKPIRKAALLQAIDEFGFGEQA